MRADFVNVLCCPSRDCGHGNLELVAESTQVLNYRCGPVEEVKEGRLVCPACQRHYPIVDYVPAFDEIFPQVLRDEAEFWSKWYGFMWKQGYLGFFDLRAPMAPLITQGIEALDPASLGRVDLGGTHIILDDHPLVRDAEWVLDIGSGTGWSSLFLARRGHKVVSFDPCTDNMRLAKRYAISQGEYIEYIGAALGFLQFKPNTFDALFALHSIHHVPDLKSEMRIAREWLCEGGGVAVDEHVRDNPVMISLAQKLQEWAQKEVYPRHRTRNMAELYEALPRDHHSALEGAGSEDVIEAITENFVVETYSSRYINLSTLSFVYYLSRDLDVKGYDYSASVLDRIYGFFHEAFPEGAEYVLMVCRKVSEPGARTDTAILEGLRVLAEGPFTLEAAEAEIARLNDIICEQTDTVDTLNNIIYVKNDYIAELERQLTIKNAHIRKIEKAVTTQQSTLSALPVRAVVRLTNVTAGRKRR